MSKILRVMPSSFAGFSKDDALRQLEAERIEAEKAAAEKKRLEDLARGNAGKGNVVAPVSVVPVVLDDLVFGPSSDERLNQPDAVRFAKKDGILQSVGEAVYARKQVGDKASWDYQRTRTGAFYVVENGKVCVAFDDVADPVNNVVVRFANEGYEDNKRGEEFIIRRSLLASVLERAKDKKRFLQVPEDSTVRASVVGSPCDYETNPYFVAVLGKEMASLNAELLRNKLHDTGRLYLLSSETVRKRVVDDEGIVRPVGLGGGGCGNVNVVSAYGGFGGSGCARGVRSAQSEGGAQ
jgi:hypothetical protein